MTDGRNDQIQCSPIFSKRGYNHYSPFFPSQAIIKINIIYYMRLYEVESYKAKCHMKECWFHIQKKSVGFTCKPNAT